jgi:hypothetical protein
VVDVGEAEVGVACQCCLKVCLQANSCSNFANWCLVAIYVAGMWDAMQPSADKPAAKDETSDAMPKDDADHRQYEDAREDSFAMPMGFGRGRGGGRGDFGRGGGRGGRGRGGLERDVKGKDWDCPSCTNTNWSWRTNCNKCGTGKPASALVRCPSYLLHKLCRTHFYLPLVFHRWREKTAMVQAEVSTNDRTACPPPLSRSTKKDLMISVGV